MNPVRINEAEAFLEPFFDTGASGLHRSYSVQWYAGASGQVRGGFAAVEVDIAPGEIGKPAVSLERSCDVDLSEYDELRMLLALPGWAQVVVALKGVDGWIDVIESVGKGTTEEYSGPLPFSRVLGVRFTFGVLKRTDITAKIRWLGVANRGSVEAMLSRPSPYTPEWPLMLKPVGEEVEFEPTIGIYFSAGRETEMLRRRVNRRPHRAGFERMVDRARAHLQDRPERQIGKLIPKPDRRFCRDRDMTRISWAHLMEDLAFVGVMEKDEALCRMAARMALSAAHCEYWFESDIGVHPGKLWHHRSFTEEVYSRACALVLDWAGFCLTDYGRRVILNAVATKGLPRIETDFIESEYIRHMNQGIVFSSGRIHGLLALASAYPRYNERVGAAERDLLEIIDDYVKEDGGTLEGPGYWHYTFMNAVATLYVLARYRRTRLDEYATEALLKTGLFGLGMLSTVGGGYYLLPINDCHRSAVHPDLASAYATITGDPKWRRVYATASRDRETEPGYFSFIIAPEEIEEFSTAVEEGFRFFPCVGQVDWVVQDDELGHVHFHFIAGPAYGGHYHCDKGSFVIEAGEDELAVDRGVTNYAHPETNLLKRSGRHNLLQPEPPGKVLPDQLSSCDPGARIVHAEVSDGLLSLACEVTGAWPEGLFQRNTRTVEAESHRVFVFRDRVACPEPTPVSFRLNTTLPVVAEDSGVRIVGKCADLVVAAVDWTPAETTVEEDGIDGAERPVTLVRLVSQASHEHALTTRVEVVAKQTREAEV